MTAFHCLGIIVAVIVARVGRTRDSISESDRWTLFETGWQVRAQDIDDRTGLHHRGIPGKWMRVRRRESTGGIVLRNDRRLRFRDG